MYDSISGDYDRFVNWENRLGFEMIFLESQIKRVNTSGTGRVLDTACGTGMHTIELARRGYLATGTDLSTGMIAKAVENARDSDVQVEFRAAGFGELSRWYRDYDALLCLGNSLPHVLSLEEQRTAIMDFAACLRPGGLLLIQNRNFDLVIDRKLRWMEPESHRSSDGEWLFLRFYDFDPDGLITFNMITLKRGVQSNWDQKISSARLYPLRAGEIMVLLEELGFEKIELFGGMDGCRFEPLSSPNLVVSAFKRS